MMMSTKFFKKVIAPASDSCLLVSFEMIVRA